MKQSLIDSGRFFVVALAFIAVFFSSVVQPTDPDLGWHLRYGEYFFQHKMLLFENTFSTEMPEYRYINSAWGTDIITYAAFRSGGFFCVSLLGAGVVALTLLFFSWALRFAWWEQALLFPLITFLENPLFSNSFRGQYLSLLGIAILYFLISQFENGRKGMLFLTVPLFFLWVNIHGQFLLGFVLFIMWALVYLVRLWATQKKKKQRAVWEERRMIYFCLFASGIVTLFNPFGIGIYEEALRHTTYPLKMTIEEWRAPLIYSPLWWRLVFLGIMLFISVVILFLQKKVVLYSFYMLAVFSLFFLSFDSRRFMWPLFFVSVPLLVVTMRWISLRYARLVQLVAFLVLVGFYWYASFVHFPMENPYRMDWYRYCLYIGCSPSSAEFLTQKKLPGKLYSQYDWGGWLIWNYPLVKPSIDGRMCFWHDEKTGYNAFAKYYLYENNLSDIHESAYDIVYIPAAKPVYYRMMQLVKEKKWEVAYQDGFAFVFVRVKHSKKA